MKFFWLGCGFSKNINAITLLVLLLVFSSCATHHSQYGKKAMPSLQDSIAARSADSVAHRFYLVGDAGYANEPNAQVLIKNIGSRLEHEAKNTTLFFLGDNIYPLGMPAEDNKDRKEAEASLNTQIALAKLFSGKTYFIPGNHDWYHGIKGLQEQEKLVDKALGKGAFLPAKSCGLDDVKINDNITMIVVDSQWYFENWDDYPTINDDCDIKTRAAFLLELESLLNKNQDKNIVLAIHHPLMSNGAHGGQLSARKELYPLKYKVPMPIVGSLINLVRRTSGASEQDLQSRVYGELSKRIQTLIQGRNNVIVISGHDHNLQYIEKNNIHQIISGAGSKEEGARALGDHDFSYGGRGYAIVDFYKNGTSAVHYYKVGEKGEEQLFEAPLLQKKQQLALKEYRNNFPADTAATIYTKKETTHGGFYKFLFGNHYRKYYDMPIHTKMVVIDTLYGGLNVGREGGGHQSNSLRLIDKKGREYVMRAVKKSASRFLQSTAFPTKYIGDDYDGTFAESFLLDFYTSSHPFTPLIIDDLEEAVGIYHTNPELYYIPKQNGLKRHNELHGDALYIVEERPTDEFSKLDSFGNPDGIDGTDDVHAKLAKSKKNVIDERAYIRVRLFDLMVGDWDRHADQWRWSKFKTADSTYYRPIPRDRDQAFPKYGGALLSVLMQMPPLRYMKPYKGDIGNVKWQAKQGYTQDVAFITKSGENVWLEEAAYLKEHLTDAVIDESFAKLPPEVRDGDMETIKKNLKSRRDKLAKYALDYRKVLLKTVVLTGTDKKERFVITRGDKGATKVEIYSIKKDGDSLAFTQLYNRKQTRELWIYGLDDDDIFEVKGKPEHPIKLRLIGGQNNDTYAVEDGRKVNIYDFKTKKNTYETDSKTSLKLTDDYETNSYDYKKPNYNIFIAYPMIGFNPDDGVKLGAVAGYTINNFNRRPYSQKHTVKANYFFATQGFELGYRGVFMNVSSKWNIGLDARFTSPNFSINYFGLGNETKNDDDEMGMDYNRVKLQVFRVAPSFFKQGKNGSFMELKMPFETIEVDGTHNRFVNQPGLLTDYLFEHRQYGGVEGTYSFENYDNKALPALGFKFYATGGWKASFDVFERNFAHAETGLSIFHKITRNERLVFATTFKGRFIFNDNYEFYQGATLGGDADLRGYRRERFTGRSMYYQSSDLRYTIGKFKSVIPFTYGVLGGYDYGRIWLNGESSDKWHQSAGGGLWINGAEALTARVTCFYGSDGARVAFGLSLGL
ncbi:metallophosphoesterase [Flavobacterium psychrotrophum]|uniref:metallophosphoesterase n=1 Tax=Flavobacterium psychrotrophum TaxID=2294119 RepID=UPI000E318A7D|nr:metallophosphoesterase [Flavobacterium psychrotrophum]